MSFGNNKSINNALNRSYALMDSNTRLNAHKAYEFRKQTILDNESLTENEKSEAIRILTQNYDLNKLTLNEGTKRICENCNQECLATTYCEYCVRNYLKAKFSDWTSGNVIIDNLIQECQMKTIVPSLIPEWIPYNSLQNIEYLTKGGFSEIYTANRIDDPSNGDYMLVMNKLDIDLRKYLQQNHNQLTWKKRIQIITDITLALRRIHEENAIHRDLHSGNILYNLGSAFRISDLGFCGPADKPLKSIYGNLPYIAPEVIIGKEQTFKSDIYSIGMLMWEVSSGQAPFINYEHDYDLAMNIVNGIRPKIVLGTPLEYKNLMKQCWDADPSKRPDSYTLQNKMNDINLFYQSKSNESLTQPEENSNFEIENCTGSSKLFTSKLHQFDNLPEPRNATEGIY
ncbi:Sps1p [Rhizophagus irregularis DAOM 197198w]|uniref:Sps1p n=1 Tax=Rhizophagus irregularis (strain DAOM 197198w) TaxID=1432141 RepID=A0A015JMS9_RHIIW|nr:Sps1p [Rhizophagus irregularis DAOM 197198w]